MENKNNGLESGTYILHTDTQLFTVLFFVRMSMPFLVGHCRPYRPVPKPVALFCTDVTSAVSDRRRVLEPATLFCTDSTVVSDVF